MGNIMNQLNHSYYAFYFSRLFFRVEISFLRLFIQNSTNLLNVLSEELKSIGLLLSAPKSLMVGYP